ncbi:hypothetical protein GCM10025781_27070 [Kocuria gwangalliensis]|uniref:Uncharacterized protein n=1 Tax=Kocuria gwangalliensis TaxID=501592 RepID=A0ABP8XGK9_9MICC
MSVQRVVKWSQPLAKSFWHQVLPEGAWGNDLDHGTVSWLDIDATALTRTEPYLAQALTRHGQLGRTVQHSHSVVGSNRIWTFVVDFA